ncbi:MAG: PD40 domain-containing protein [Sedimentisphaerales bacterium]|nr:PD40 domain-containing protein [Sedimentisphaerales bacterium]
MNKTGDPRMVVALWAVLAVLWSYGQTARADFTYDVPTTIPEVSRPGAGGSHISPDGLELYFTYSAGSECPGLWVAQRSTTKQPWGTPVRLPAPVNAGGPVGSMCLSADGLELYLGEGHPMLWKPGYPADPNGFGGGDLWVLKRATKSDPWGARQNLGPAVNTPSWEDQPSLSPDGLSLYFASDRSGSSALWVITRTDKLAGWGPRTLLGAPFSTSTQVESCPFISPDGLSLYFSRGDLRPDIYVSSRTTTNSPWGLPVLFTPISLSGGKWLLSFSAADSTYYFTWADSVFGVFDVRQVKVLPILDFNGDGKADENDYFAMTQHWGEEDPLYDIGPTAWGDGVVDVHDQTVFLETTEGRDFAVSPSPHATDLPLNMILNWTLPQFAETQDVYFGTSFLDVSEASRGDPREVLVSQGQVETTYDPEGGLDFDQTYYWRIDFVSAEPDPAIYKGAVWQFTTEPAMRPIENVQASASSFSVGMEAERTVDRSGLDADDLHSSAPTDMWRTPSRTSQPRWIRYTFDDVYTVHEMWVWNFNAPDEPVNGLGARTVKIEYSTDSTTWTVLDGVPEFAQAPGQDGYAANTKVNFHGVPVKFVKLTITETWGGKAQTGLSEVRFYTTSAAVAAEP